MDTQQAPATGDIRGIPDMLLELLEKRGLTGKILAYACADMTKDNDLCNTHLVLTDTVLMLAREIPRGATRFAGTSTQNRCVTDADITEVDAYPLAALSNPMILNQVVGGLLLLSVDGTERLICRFSSAKMREMRKLADAMEEVVQTDKKEDKHSERRHPVGGRRGRGRRRQDDEELFCPKCGAPYPEAGRAVCPKCMKRGVIFLRVLSFFKPYRVRVAVMLGCLLASAVLNAVWPYVSGTLFYDGVLNKDPVLASRLGTGENFLLMLGLLVIAMVVIRLLQQITGVIQGRMTAAMVPGVVANIKTAVFESLQKLSLGFFTRSQTGSLMQRVNGDANEVMHFFIDGLPYLLFNLFTIITSAWIMFTIDWRLTLISLAILPVLFFVSYTLLPKLWHAHGRLARVNRSLYSVLNDGITGARVVKAFGQEDSEVVRFDKASNRVRASELQIVKYRNIFEGAYRTALDIPVLIVWCAGAFFIVQSGGEFAYGKLYTFIIYSGMLQGPISFFAHVFQWWAQSMHAAQRVFEIIDTLPEIKEAESPVEKKLKGHIELRGVRFGYLPNKPVLHDISFEIEAGRMLGIVGKSGAGKSTLANLISRLYDTESGDILLDGVNIRDLSFASLRGAVAMVSQETYIFIGTIFENIAYARPGATRQEVVQAAIAASAHNFICKLPDGYDTLIGAGGRQLSGGERQRVSIARAMLADPQILILDEATASVDTETERAIQDSLDMLIKGRTTISIAHRLSTLRSADSLIVLDNGKLVEKGTHAELIRQKGTYYKLLQIQSKALAMRGIGD